MPIPYEPALKLTFIIQPRERLRREHEISRLLDRSQEQARKVVKIHSDVDGSLAADMQALSVGDPFAEFYRRLNDVKEYHNRYPNEPVENLELSYRKTGPHDDSMGINIDAMFTGEEAWGRYFDLMALHNEYINLPIFQAGAHRRPTYVQYIDTFDQFAGPLCLLRKKDKLTDSYFKYLNNLSTYLETFMRNIRPLDDLDTVFSSFDREFEDKWDKKEIESWNEPEPTQSDGHSIWCDVCQKEFTNPNTYDHHINSKKHKKAVETRKAEANGDGAQDDAALDLSRIVEKTIVEREFRIKKLAAAMQNERADTKSNVERRQGMTEKERQEELERMNNADLGAEEESREDGADNGDDEEDSIYNPLKLPLAWDGKPIPFWLYKLHGLGNEFHCEICGNFTYMGRRTFDKHFNETRHIHGLKCLGITNTTLFRDITSIPDALALNKKMIDDKEKEAEMEHNVVEMEDRYGNVMPQKVYEDLQKQGLL